jgi:hypothetical protein
MVSSIGEGKIATLARQVNAPVGRNIWGFDGKLLQFGHRPVL